MSYRLGIDLGGTNIAAGIVSERGALIGRASLPCLPQRGVPAVLDDIARCSRLAAENAGIAFSELSGGGLGAPGVCAPASGAVLLAPNLGWRNVPAGDMLEERLGFRPAVGNDADCAALGEYRAGAAGKYLNMVFVTLGTGVGGGAIVNGKLCTGRGGAGEIGHIVIRMGGEPCPCGRRGCFERYASAEALISQTRAAAENDPASLIWKLCGGSLSAVDGRTAFDAAALGDGAAAAVVDTYITYLAEGAADLINIFQPEALLLGGGISLQGEALLAPLREKLARMVYAPEALGVPEILAASLGNDAGVIGAALLEA